MPSFEDSMRESKAFIEGWHTCRVIDFETDLSGTPRINFELWSPSGKCAPVKVYITEAASWVYRNFAVACGTTRDERQSCEGDTLWDIAVNMAEKLIGRMLDVRFTKGEPNKNTGKQYVEAAEFRPASAEIPPFKKERIPQEWRETSAPVATGADSDLPF